MNVHVAKILLRVIGTLGGLLGLGMLCVAPIMFFHSVGERNPWMILLAAFPLAMSAYLIYVGYLVWFRFSPLAVRHICGALGFYIITLVPKISDPSRDPSSPWGPFLFLACLVAVYFGYRSISGKLSRWLFPERV